jgi:hypothetical protein
MYWLPRTDSWLSVELGPIRGCNHPSLCVTMPHLHTITTIDFPLREVFYYIAFPKDRWICKCLVYGVYTLETLQTIIITHDAFASFGLGFGSFEALDSIQFTCLSIPILSGIGQSDFSPSSCSLFILSCHLSRMCRPNVLCLSNQCSLENESNRVSNSDGMA